MYKTIKLAAAILLIALSASSEAKTRHFGNNNTNTRPQGLLDGTDAKRLSSSEIENRFRPFLEERVRERRGGIAGGVRGARAARPSERDLFLLMKVWDNLSAEFRALYSEATAKPRNADSLISPMGKFKIFYTTSGRDSVDITDNTGYGVKGQPNGIPDYIDEAAFALDSAWSMLVGRFKFIDPIAAGGSDYYYPIYISLMDDYGVTWPESPEKRFPGGKPGVFSHIEINSDWSDPDWDIYNKRPYDALRVTCAHEFFHAVQYAMVWTVINNIYLDDFPLAWLEGSAVLMEEIAFPDINDYFQYIKDFFGDPRIPFLSDDYKYLNSILFKYLYEKTNPIDSIGFVKTMHFNNYNNRTAFHTNIEQVSANHAGKSWAEVLNGFHTESYFTGRRARRPRAFITDADSMDSWAIPDKSITGAETKTVKPCSVEFFRYTPQDSHADTLILNISGEIDRLISGRTWGASVLVMEKNDSAGIITIPIGKNGAGLFKLGEWKEKNGCLLVVTNASHTTERKITVTTEREGFNPPNEGIVTISHNVVKLRTATQPVRISGEGVTEVKVYSADGKLVWSGKNSANGAAEWPVEKYKRLTPGTYFLTAASGKNTLKRKIMILP